MLIGPDASAGDAIARGKKAYAETCSGCHGPDLEGLRTTRDNLKNTIHDRTKLLNSVVRGLAPGSAHIGQIPALAQFNQSEGVWRKHMIDSQDMWGKINATPPPGVVAPLVLPDATTLAAYTTTNDLLRQCYEDLELADQNVGYGIDLRDEIYFKVHEELNAYRPSVMARFVEDHPLVLSIPRLNPLPGHTPDPVARLTLRSANGIPLIVERRVPA